MMKMMMWEYKVVGATTSVSDVEAALETWGKEGWELVAVVPPPPPLNAVAARMPFGRTPTFYFKRPLLSVESEESEAA